MTPKPGARALGVAESYRNERSTLAGAVVRADRAVDGLVFDQCTVGGSDATASVEAMWSELDREDVRYVLLAGVAPAWFNLFDVPRLNRSLGVPVLAVSFESSPGLEDALREQFDGAALESRLETYRAQPERTALTVNDERVFVRASGVGDERAAEIVRAYTPAGGRPEPLRVARIAARAGDEYRRASGPSGAGE